MTKNLRISSYIRKPFLIYDFATSSFWNSFYMRKILFYFLSVCRMAEVTVHELEIIFMDSGCCYFYFNFKYEQLVLLLQNMFAESFSLMNRMRLHGELCDVVLRSLSTSLQATTPQQPAFFNCNPLSSFFFYFSQCFMSMFIETHSRFNYLCTYDYCSPVCYVFVSPARAAL